MTSDHERQHAAVVVLLLLQPRTQPVLVHLQASAATTIPTTTSMRTAAPRVRGLSRLIEDPSAWPCKPVLDAGVCTICTCDTMDARRRKIDGGHQVGQSTFKRPSTQPAWRQSGASASCARAERSIIAMLDDAMGSTRRESDQPAQARERQVSSTMALAPSP